MSFVQPHVRDQAAAALARYVQGFSLRRSTVDAYSTQQRHLVAIATRLRVDLSRTISERDLCCICAVYALDGHKITTLPTFVAAANHWHVNQFNQQLPRGWSFKATLSGLANIFADSASSRQAVGISLNQLRLMRAQLELSSFDDTRDWCCILFAFFGLMRISEYANGGLRQNDVLAFNWGIEITLPFSKTSPTPVKIALSRRYDELCPLAAYQAYTAMLGPSRLSLALPFFLERAGS